MKKLSLYISLILFPIIAPVLSSHVVATSLPHTSSLNGGYAKSCLTDGFGYSYDMHTTGNSGSIVYAEGTVDVGSGTLWTVMASEDKSTNELTLTATNPNPDFCNFYSDSYTFVGKRYGKNVSGDWSNNCGASGTFTGVIAKGSCPDGEKKVLTNGPASALPSGSLKQGYGKSCFADEWGYQFSMHVTGADATNIYGEGTVDINFGPFPIWPVTAVENKITHETVITATNPNPDGCDVYSDWFIYTGIRAGATYSGSWVNNCDLSGTFTGSISKGLCPSLKLTGNAGNSPGKGKAEVKLEKGSNNISNLEVYPVPSNSTTSVSFEVKQAGKVSMELYTMMGQLAMSIGNSELLEGSHLKTFNVSKLTEGNYMLVIRTATGTQHQVITVVH